MMSPPRPFILRFFHWYIQRHLRRHFHAVRLLHGPPDIPAGQPLIVFLNHASWWDPLAGLFLSRCFFPDRELYGPMDESQLHRFPILGKVGLFGIEPGTARGARQLLRAADFIFARPSAALWLTPQGRFADVRERPLALARGLKALAERYPGALLLPIALEYTFWNDRLPELLVHCGSLCPGAEAEPALETAMDQLKAASLQRDPRLFRQLLSGRGGTGGVYDFRRDQN